MATLTLVAANVSADWNQGSVIRNFIAAAAVTVGAAVALDSAGKLVLADADALATARAIGIVVNGTSIYGGTSIAIGASASVCVLGPVYGYYGMDETKPAYISGTAGELVDAVPGSGYNFIIGRPVSETVLWVNPGVSAPVSI